MNDDLKIDVDVMLALAEEDYLYGAGDIALRVEQIGADPSSFPKLEWVRIVGKQIYWNGVEIPRDVMVRVASIQKSFRPPEWRPTQDPHR
jgi:hypothetical protein